jgi:hypothetical protein
MPESDTALTAINAARDAVATLLATPRAERSRDATLAVKALVDAAMAEEPITLAARTARVTRFPCYIVSSFYVPGSYG